MRAGRGERRQAIFWRGIDALTANIAEATLVGVAEIQLADDSASVVAGGDATFQGVGTIEGTEASYIAGGDVGSGLVSVATLSAQAEFTGDAEATLQAVATLAADIGQALLAEMSVAAVATFTAEGTGLLGGEASLQGIAEFAADMGGIQRDGEAFLQAVSYLAVEPEHIIPSMPWATWSGQLANQRLLPGEQIIGSRRMKVG